MLEGNISGEVLISAWQGESGWWGASLLVQHGTHYCRIGRYDRQEDFIEGELIPADEVETLFHRLQHLRERLVS